MKRILLITSVTALSIAAELAVRDGEQEQPVNARDPRLIELELELATADLALTGRGADLDTKRAAFASIIESHEWLDDRYKPAAAEPDDSHEPVELEVPQRDGLPVEEFLSEAGDFMAKLHAASTRGVSTEADMDAARALFAQMEEHEHVRALSAAMAEAREELEAKRREEAGAWREEFQIELRETDVGSLPLEERIPMLLAEIDLELTDQGRMDDLDERRRRKAGLDHLVEQHRWERTARSADPQTYIKERIDQLNQELEMAAEQTEQ